MGFWSMLGSLLKDFAAMAEENNNRREATRMRYEEKDSSDLVNIVKSDGWFSPSDEEKAIAVKILKARRQKAQESREENDE
ncbi:TPA: transposase [Neisseria bacilliformis]|jgi:hypothetical protein|uniref:Uncharacterized protein n=1 Tax=Neisseria bacilliformis ATCC BAA-1200 TaxID=888742 RepID=F2BGD9_9NEIS|nr:hypothetical protein [Neisseria bacilliformis]EGF06836.1 hypothetical protein HMPREF9123_2796 [Neisseria bacilliformis ATCC BAA-1200]QMT47293.1 transposase [Neisseria bacilliformis]